MKDSCWRKAGTYSLIMASYLGMALSIISLGVFRNEILIPRLGWPQQHVKLLLLPLDFALIFAFSWTMVSTAAIRNARISFRGLGMLLVVATVILESLIGIRVEGRTYAEVLADYNPLRGNTWIVVVAFIGVAPVLAEKARLTLLTKKRRP